MIVTNTRYLKIRQVEELIKKGIQFSIYKTHKNTEILVKGAKEDNIQLYYPDMSRVEWKTEEGRRIIGGKKIFDSSVDKDFPPTQGWNNGNQIMSYEEFSYPYW
jgi:hypothetical protein